MFIIRQTSAPVGTQQKASVRKHILKTAILLPMEVYGKRLGGYLWIPGER